MWYCKVLTQTHLPYRMTLRCHIHPGPILKVCSPILLCLNSMYRHRHPRYITSHALACPDQPSLDIRALEQGVSFRLSLGHLLISKWGLAVIFSPRAFSCQMFCRWGDICGHCVNSKSRWHTLICCFDRLRFVLRLERKHTTYTRSNILVTGENKRGSRDRVLSCNSSRV